MASASDDHQLRGTAPIRRSSCTDRIELHIVDLTRSQTVERVTGRGGLRLPDERRRRSREVGVSGH